MSDGTSGPVIIEDWAPLASSLHFHLGQFSYQRSGGVLRSQKDFPSQSNQGTIAGARAAEILFANCQEADGNSSLPDSITCLELGMGDASFSLQLLDRFKEMCETNDKDFYGRLTWFATDDSPEVLFEVEGRNIFERHPDIVVLAQIDALEPNRATLHSSRELVDLSSGHQAIFANYVLSALPAEVWCHQPDGEDEWQGAMVRVIVDDWEQFEPICAYTREALVGMAAEPTMENLDALSSVYELLQPEFTLGAADVSDIPRLAALKEMAATLGSTESGTWILDSNMALSALDTLVAGLNPDGFVLIRDFGPCTVKEANQSHCYRNFGSITAFPVNFWQLDQHFASPTTKGMSTGISDDLLEPKCRLFCLQELPQTNKQLEASFGAQRFKALADVVESANVHAAEPAKYLGKILEAIDLEPMNWSLMSEAATYALTTVEDADTALELAIKAAEMNPAYASEAWKVLGDIKFWIHQDLDLAADAFQNAVASDSSDPAAHLGLQMVFSARKDPGGALIAAAAAVAEDTEGVFHEHALQILKSSIDELVAFYEVRQKYQNNTFSHDG